MPTTCFMLRPTGRHRVFYRRYSFGDGEARDCTTGGSYHNAKTLKCIEPDRPGVVDLLVSKEMRALHVWPPKCDHCAYTFQDSDEWQLFSAAIFANDLGVEFNLNEATPGAMWHAYWFDAHETRAPDGNNLIVVCPGGQEWWIDGSASNGPGWTRTGDPPRITCSPSIQTSNYHGFLRDGVFTDDLEGRKY